MSKGCSGEPPADSYLQIGEGRHPELLKKWPAYKAWDYDTVCTPLKQIKQARNALNHNQVPAPKAAVIVYSRWRSHMSRRQSSTFGLCYKRCNWTTQRLRYGLLRRRPRHSRTQVIGQQLATLADGSTLQVPDVR